LTRRAAKDSVDLAVPCGVARVVPTPPAGCRSAYVIRVDATYVSAEHFREGKIDTVGCRVYGVVFDGREHVEPCLLESEAHPACAREHIDRRWPSSRPTASEQLAYPCR
jgi:hypothetical protein